MSETDPFAPPSVSKPVVDVSRETSDVSQTPNVSQPVEAEVIPDEPATSSIITDGEGILKRLETDAEHLAAEIKTEAEKIAGAL